MHVGWSQYYGLRIPKFHEKRNWVISSIIHGSGVLLTCPHLIAACLDLGLQHPYPLNKRIHWPWRGQLWGTVTTQGGDWHEKENGGLTWGKGSCQPQVQWWVCYQARTSRPLLRAETKENIVNHNQAIHSSLAKRHIRQYMYIAYL